MISIMYINSAYSLLMYKGDFMTLIEAWKDSLRVLIPERLENLVIETWHAMREVFWVLWTPWFFALMLISYAVELAGVPYIDLFFYSLFLAIIFLAALPSSQVKDFNYFVTYLSKYSWAFLKLMLLFFLILLMSILFIIIGLMAIGFTKEKLGLLTDTEYISDIIIQSGAWAIILGLTFLTVIMGTWIDLVMLFYVTRDITMRSALKKSVLLLWYNLPLFILYYFLIAGIKVCSGFIPDVIPFVQVIILVFTTCLGITLYIRRINAYPALYQ